MNTTESPDPESRSGALDRFVGFFLENKLITILLLAAAVFWGLLVAPFDWDLGGLPRDPVPVDAIPDYGENQQIVFTSWPGRSPQDVEDQITYPLTVSLLGVSGVKTTRSYSYFGFSSVYVIFEDDVEFYWSRTRVLEKLGSLPFGTLPEGVQPTLGPDATPLGQIFQYTLEGRDAEGRPAGGWDLEELRSIQDWQVRFALMSVKGVSEVSSIGGFVREYQIDVDPDAMRAYEVRLEQVFGAVRSSNVDVGARTIEINRVEYVIRGLGFIKSLADIEETVIRVRDNVPIRVRDVARVSEGPALRRGALDKEGQEAVGGIVVVRYGENPLQTIERVRARIDEIAGGLPKKTLADGRESRVTIVPFYDRTELIEETLGTLRTALSDEILVTILVVLLMLMHFRSSVLVSGLLPVSVLLSFGAMKIWGVDANVVALSGIAIAIGTMVDMGVVLCENVVRHMRQSAGSERSLDVIRRATSEVSGAVITAVLTTVVSFLPVFTLEAAEGKLFKPLAYTKTFALLASVAVAIVILPALAHLFFGRGRPRKTRASKILVIVVAVLVLLVLSAHWMPLGVDRSLFVNVIFVALLLGGVYVVIQTFGWFYEPVLRWCLAHKAAFLSIPAALCAFGLLVWLGAPRFLGERVGSWFPGLGKEFMPKLSEGSFLYMPTTMPHASIGESMDALRKQDFRIRAIPEVDQVVGKIGRAESPLDPAPISMVETVISIKPEYLVDEDGNRFRQWRDEIRTEDDIWDEIERVAQIPGSTSAPMLQPIETRLVMLQTGMRAPMGVKVIGPDLESLEKASLQIEKLLRMAPAVKPETVNADRVIGKPYLEIDIDRPAIARHGISVRRVQDVIEVAIGGKRLTTTVEGRERYPVRVRYLRELRDSIESLERILVEAPDGTHIPLGQLAEVRYRRGPMVIKGEDSRLVAYITFDKAEGRAEVDVVEDTRDFLREAEENGQFERPAGVDYRFAGNYENQVRSTKRLRIMIPAALLIIVLILYFQFRSLATTLIVFSGVFVAWAGGFQMLWLYGQDWFLDAVVFGESLRDLFQVRPYNLSVAVWVGFLALFGIATDDGVINGTYLKQTFARRQPKSREEIREAVVEAGNRRIRACLMTVATTILALIPVLTSTGRGADVMVPMAIPSFGGMTVALITVFVVPTLYSLKEEWKLRSKSDDRRRPDGRLGVDA